MLAELLELAPGGVEEVERRRRRRVRRLRRARRAARPAATCARPPAMRWWRSPPPRWPTTGPSAGAPSTSRVQVGDALRAPAVGARRAGRPARRRHRPRPGVRHGRAPDHAAVPGAAARARRPAGRAWSTSAAARACWPSPRRELGWAPVLGIDHERESVAGDRRERARSTASRCGARAGTCCATGPRPRAPIVLANLLRPLLLALAERLRGARPTLLIASGLLAHEADEVAGAFARHGLREAGAATAASGWRCCCGARVER